MKCYVEINAKAMAKERKPHNDPFLAWPKQPHGDSIQPK